MKYTPITAGICLLTLLLCAVSCSNDTQTCPPADDTTHAETSVAATTAAEPEEVLPQFSDVFTEQPDFGGEEIRFFVELGWDDNARMKNSLYIAEDSADVVDSAVYRRNAAVAEYLNVTFADPLTCDPSDLLKNMRKYISAGDDSYDIVAAYQAYSASCSAMNYVCNLEDLPYLHPENEYWGTRYIEEMSYNGTYWLVGDISYLYTGGFFNMFVNKRLWNSYFPDDSIYDIVNEGKWTLDLLCTCSEEVYMDLNNNGIVDFDDRVGLLYSNVDPFIFSSGVTYTTRDKDGTPVLSLMNERTVSIWDKLSRMVDETPGILKHSTSHSGLDFARGYSLFAVDALYRSIDEMRDMEDDFYLIPCPKFDEAQENYITQIADDVTIFAVPITNERSDVTAAVLEAMAIESYRTLRPAYYETALKGKYTRDMESAHMIDLIRSTITTDFGLIYGEAIGGGIGKTGNGLFRIFRTADEKDMDSITALYEKNESKYEQYFADLLAAFDAQAIQ